MRQHQVQAEWRRAQKALQAAALLQQNGLAEDAISRAYYAAMHAAKAALLVHADAFTSLQHDNAMLVESQLDLFKHATAYSLII